MTREELIKLIEPIAIEVCSASAEVAESDLPKIEKLYQHGAGVLLALTMHCLTRQDHQMLAKIVYLTATVTIGEKPSDEETIELMKRAYEKIFSKVH